MIIVSRIAFFSFGYEIVSSQADHAHQLWCNVQYVGEISAIRAIGNIAVTSIRACQQFVNSGSVHRYGIQWIFCKGIKIAYSALWCNVSCEAPAGTVVPDIPVEIIQPDQQAVTQTSDLKIPVEVLLNIDGKGCLIFIMEVLTEPI